MRRFALILALFALLPACSSTTEKGEVDVERKQFFLVPSSQIVSLSEQAYDQTKSDAAKKGELDHNPEQLRRVQAVAKRLIPVTGYFRKDAPGWAWETHVISSPEINAYCMPGGKIIFYSGIIEKMQLTDGEMAAIMGHEITHALREHGRERMTEELIKGGLLQALLLSGKLNPDYAGAANVVTSLAVSLPFSRLEETEADEIGVELMARAGYDPREALTLWKKMAAMGGSKPPQILSDHPADANRIKNIERLIPKVMPLYKQ